MMQKRIKPTIILGGRKEQVSTGEASAVKGSQQSSPNINLSTLINRPVIIRYIDPRLVPLLAELGKLSDMVQKYAEKIESSNSLDEKIELSDLVKSSKDLEAKMINIIEQQETGFPQKSSSIGKEPEEVESELKYVSKQFLSSKKLLSGQEIQNIEDIDMLAILNKVSVRIDEMQTESQQLKGSLASEREENARLRAELESLRRQMREGQ